MSQTANKLIQASAGNVGDADDSDFANVVLLLDGDGTSGDDNNTFTDSSTNAFSINTGAGIPTQGTFNSTGNNWSNSFDGSSYFTTPSSADFNFGTGDFTIEFWVYPTSYPQTISNGQIFGTVNQSRAGYAVHLGRVADEFRMTSNASGGWADDLVVSSGGGPVVGEWTHMAVVRDGDSLEIFKNGTSVASRTGVSAYNYSGTTGVIGVFDDGPYTRYVNGFISNLRVTKGTAIYTSSFTPSTTPLSSVTGTGLLACQSNRFIDNSSNGLALTINGTPKVTRFSPFKNDDARDIATDSGSALFSGPYLVAGANTNWTFIHNNLSTWTISTRVYRTSQTTGTLFSTNVNSISGAQGMTYYIDSSGTLSGSFTRGTDGYRLDWNCNTTNIVPLNQWVDVALTFTHTNSQGSKLSAVVDGVSYTNFTEQTIINNNPNNNLFAWTTNTASFAAHIGTYRGTASGTGNKFEGYIDSYEITKDGSNYFDLNFEDAGIYDLTGLNNIKTVGNAQIDTAVVKYGTGSMEFDGTGDYLTIPSTQDVALGSGDFTIECWANFSVVGAGNGQGLFQFSNGYLNSQDGRGPGIGISNSNGQWYIYYGAGTNLNTTLGSSPSANTWYHVAFVRTSGVIKIFIDGTQIGSDISYSGNYTDTYLTIGGWYSTSFLFTGYIDDLRITKGIARYTSNFTAPTKALPNF